MFFTKRNKCLKFSIAYVICNTHPPKIRTQNCTREGRFFSLSCFYLVDSCLFIVAVIVAHPPKIRTQNCIKEGRFFSLSFYHVVSCLFIVAVIVARVAAGGRDVVVVIIAVIVTDTKCAVLVTENRNTDHRG